MSVQLRQFISKHSHNQSASASAYYETQSTEGKQGTKLSVSLFGPMQLQSSQNTILSERCQLKTTIEFADED